jgi:hypothetical protein
MASREQLYAALRNADAAGDVEGARKLAAYIKSMPADAAPDKPETTLSQDVISAAKNTAMGFGRGVKDVLDTGAQLLSSGFDKITGTNEGERVRQMNQADQDEFKRDYGDSTAASIGRIGGNIAITLPVGPVLGSVVRAAAPAAAPLANALATSGMRAGSTPGAVNMLARVAGGAGTGATSAGLVNPDDAGTGAAIGAVLPPALVGAGRTAAYLANGARSLVQPFTSGGQEAIAGNIVRRFAEGGPTQINAATLVPGSAPTLAEATANPGLATLQRTVQDIRPNAFVERQAQNAAARNSAFEGAAGDRAQLDFFRTDRSTVADQLYGAARDAYDGSNATPFVKGQITQLLKRPSIDSASREAQRLAMERGEKPAAEGSFQALQDVKTILDDKIAAAVRDNQGGQAKALQATQAKLIDVMERLSPEYAEARNTYAAMSQPVNAMEALQGLKLTDQYGNITLAKVKNAIDGLERQRSMPGANNAKSITDDQLGVLRAIQQDLLRQSNIGLGRSVGSNTFQNIATDNIVNSLGGNALSRTADRLGVSGVAGQAGRLLYSGPNEAIRNRLADIMLDPQRAQAALSGTTPANMLNINPAVLQLLYRAQPGVVPAQGSGQ